MRLTWNYCCPFCYNRRFEGSRCSLKSIDEGSFHLQSWLRKTMFKYSNGLYSLVLVLHKFLPNNKILVKKKSRGRKMAVILPLWKGAGGCTLAAAAESVCLVEMKKISKYPEIRSSITITSAKVTGFFPPQIYCFFQKASRLMTLNIQRVSNKILL